MPARDMAAYMRARRARQRAEREAAEPLADATIPRGALLKESAEDLSRIRAKVDAIGPGAVITKTNGRLDVLSRKDIEARDFAGLPRSSRGQASRPYAHRAATLNGRYWREGGARTCSARRGLWATAGLGRRIALHSRRRISRSHHNHASGARGQIRRARATPCRPRKSRRQPSRRHAWRFARARRNFQIRPDRARLE